MHNYREILKNLSILTQLGLSLLMPVLLCLLLCWFLVNRFGLPVWIFIPGLVLGLGASAVTGYKFYQMVMKDQKKDTRSGFNHNLHL